MTAPDFAIRPQLAEDVARYVRKRIFDGTYAAGQYMRLDQLAAELGISVTPVREALFQSERRGSAGPAAAPRFRGAAGDAAETSPTSPTCRPTSAVSSPRGRRSNITDEQLRELESIQTELEDAYASDDDERAVRLNHEFHRAINVAADSPKLAQLMSQITRYAPESVFPDVDGLAEAVDRSIIGGLLAALARRDEELARAAMSEHLAAGAAPLIEHLTQRGVVD